MIRRGKMGSLLLLGLAAFGAYKYSKLSDQQKRDLLGKGNKLVSDNFNGLGNVLKKKPSFSHAGNGTL